MKITISLGILLLMFTSSFISAGELFQETAVPNSSLSTSMRVMSYNIRMAPAPEDDGTENDWKHRLPKVSLILKTYLPDIVSLQEMSLTQQQSLSAALEDESYRIVGRFPSRPPKESGLGFAYRSTRIDLLEDIKIVWLNEAGTSAEGAAWDGSNYERFVVYAKFRHLASGNEFWAVTTHFDHLGERARMESAKIVMDLVNELDAPAIVTGDFNCFPQAGGKELYETLSTRNPRIQDSGVTAARRLGVEGSWIGWSYDPYRQKTGHAKYDYIFIDDSFSCSQHAVLDDKVMDANLGGRALYPSDHRPVLSDLDWKNVY